MGQNGYLVFYTKRKPKDPVAKLRELLQVFDDERVSYWTRTLGRDRQWKGAKEIAKVIRRIHRRGEPAILSGSVYESVNPREHSFEAFSMDEAIELAPNLFRKGRRLTLALHGLPYAERIKAGYERDLPVEVRSDSCMASMGMTIDFGPHDVFGANKDPDRLKYFARAFTSVQFEGYSSAGNWANAEEMTLQIPEVVEAKAAFERVVGPMMANMYWCI